MLLQDLLWLVLSAVIVRAVWRTIDGVMEGLSGRPASRRSDKGVPARGVQMARDPVCGTYVVPSSAVVISEGSRQVFFCSTGCREKYRSSHQHAEGRSA